MIASNPFCLRTLLFSIACVGNAFASERGVRFDSPNVLDLARRTTASDIGKPVATGPLSVADADVIRNAKAVTEEPSSRFSFSENGVDCEDGAAACMTRQEAMLIAPPHGAAERLGQRLVVRAAVGPPAVFVNSTVPATKTADGDSETYWYVGRWVNNGFYHRVLVQFGHDAPGNFLINPNNGKIAFVHSASDVVALSADGMYLFTFNALNPPLSLRVARLDEVGPRLVLVCSVRDDDRTTRAEFKGWGTDYTFGLVVHTVDRAEKHSTALRLANTADAWTAMTSDLAEIERAGFACKSL